MHRRLPPSSRLRWGALPLLLGLAGCDVMGVLGIETAAQLAAQKEAEGKAIGSGCRHAERSIEECYQNNPRAGKAAVFAGWREMDEYMRENKVAAMPPRPKASVIDETADGEPLARAGSTPSTRPASTAATSAVRPTSAGSPLPSIKPATPGAVTPPARPGNPSGTGATRPANTTPPQRSS